MKQKNTLTFEDASLVEKSFQEKLAQLTQSSDNGPDEIIASANGIDKSLLAISEPRRLRNKEHLRFVAGQACLVCGRQPSDPHHLKFAQPRAMGRKVSDEFVVPLCRTHHREVHRAGSELEWWRGIRLDPLPIAEGLWSQSQGLGVHANSGGAASGRNTKSHASAPKAKKSGHQKTADAAP
jgi:hypothetical protein